MADKAKSTIQKNTDFKMVLFFSIMSCSSASNALKNLLSVKACLVNIDPKLYFLKSSGFVVFTVLESLNTFTP